jgi:membrane associated rhomboid family serine protease
MGITQEIKESFKQGTTLIKLIYVNIFIFVLVKLAFLFLQLLQINSDNWLAYIAMPANPSTFIIRPWTLFTYMFLHVGFIHIIFNLLNLYWFGKLFLSYFSQRQLVGVYILGGVLGGLLYLLAFNIFPYYAPFMPKSMLLGASAGVLAIMFAVCLYVPNLQIPLILIGNVKLKYIGAVIFFISLFGISGNNAGGNLAHLGGVIFAFLFVLGIRKGKDITNLINNLIDKLVNLSKRKSKIKVQYKKPLNDNDWNTKKAATNKEIDRILDKIKQSGYNNLTADEKKTLFQQSNKQ